MSGRHFPGNPLLWQLSTFRDISTRTTLIKQISYLHFVIQFQDYNISSFLPESASRSPLSSCFGLWKETWKKDIRHVIPTQHAEYHIPVCHSLSWKHSKFLYKFRPICLLPPRPPAINTQPSFTKAQGLVFYMQLPYFVTYQSCTLDHCTSGSEILSGTGLI